MLHALCPMLSRDGDCFAALAMTDVRSAPGTKALTSIGLGGGSLGAEHLEFQLVDGPEVFGVA